MRWVICVLTVFSLSVVHADEMSTEYLKDGKLKERIEILQLQGGFAGLTGTYYQIETDGSWSSGPVLPKEVKGEPKSKGNLTEKDLAALADDLARHDLANLPNQRKIVVNPEVLKIRFGKNVSELQGRSRTQDDQAEADKAVRSRYQGIAQAVKELCKPSKN